MSIQIDKTWVFEQLDKPLDRTGYSTEKYDLAKKLFGTNDLTPMWVADMDLPTAPFIIDAIQQRLTHPNLGYTLADHATKQAIIDWHSSLTLTEKDIVFTHNVANGFFLSVQAFSAPGDKVMVMPPIYPPFLDAPKKQQRELVELPLILDSQINHYQIDFEQLEKVLQQQDIQLLLFCNPQNPSGRVWTKQELTLLTNLCIEHKVLIVSDEIHSDLTFAPYQHTPMASLSEDTAKQTITLSSPGKTFNLGGLQLGYALIQNPTLRRKFLTICQSLKIEGLTLFGYEAIKAAYSDAGKAWQAHLLHYLNENIETFTSFMAKHFPQVTLVEPQASYLVWLNFSHYFKSDQDLNNWLVKEVKVGLSDGGTFQGKSIQQTGWKRINLAVSKATLQQVLDRFETAKSSTLI